ncbi:MAG: hypothetical protein ABIA67_06715 [Candidatus Margulisiibacteriota bacterium]
MADYNEYINKLKKYESEADFDQLRSRLELRISKRAAQTRLALAGALVVLLLAFAAYFYYPTEQAGNNDDILMSYVFQQESVDGTLTDYVFSK